jgi:hypothetical protein
MRHGVRPSSDPFKAPPAPGTGSVAAPCRGAAARTIIVIIVIIVIVIIAATAAAAAACERLVSLGALGVC